MRRVRGIRAETRAGSSADSSAGSFIRCHALHGWANVLVMTEEVVPDRSGS